MLFFFGDACNNDLWICQHWKVFNSSLIATWIVTFKLDLHSLSLHNLIIVIMMIVNVQLNKNLHTSLIDKLESLETNTIRSTIIKINSNASSISSLTNAIFRNVLNKVNNFIDFSFFRSFVSLERSRLLLEGIQKRWEKLKVENTRFIACKWAQLNLMTSSSMPMLERRRWRRREKSEKTRNLSLQLSFTRFSYWLLSLLLLNKFIYDS